MHTFPLWKRLTALAVVAAAIVFALPNLRPAGTLPAWMPQQTMNLGLDLRGGSYLLLEVDVDAYMAEQLTHIEARLREGLREARIGYRQLRVTKDGAVALSLREEEKDGDAFTRIVRDINPMLVIDDTAGGGRRLSFNDQERREITTRTIQQSIEIIRRRVDETGTREPIIQRQGERRVLLQVPGLDNPEQLKRLLGKVAKLSFHMVHPKNDDALSATLPPGTKLLYSREEADGGRRAYILERHALVSGERLVDGRATFEQGAPVVAFRFDAVGARQFGEATQKNVGRLFAIVLDGEVISAPVIREPILGGSGIISGSFDVREANDLALLLRAGALPAPLTILEERTVGPSLGADSIAAGKKAAMLGVALVMVLMFLTYGTFGIFSNVALLLNMVLLVAGLTWLQATLTLPGIAGIILTMGMAVDANVLIFERIREEFKGGKRLPQAVEAGFARAFQTIIDSNLTTLIAALILFWWGSGPIRGFAVTLSLGILASMFSAILLTRFMVALWMARRPKALPY